MASKTGTVLRGRSLLIPYLLVLSGSSRRSMGRENPFRNQSTINGPVRPPRSNWGIRLILHVPAAGVIFVHVLCTTSSPPLNHASLAQQLSYLSCQKLLVHTVHVMQYATDLTVQSELQYLTSTCRKIGTRWWWVWRLHQVELVPEILIYQCRFKNVALSRNAKVSF